jgi:HlyD family secretion protein
MPTSKWMDHWKIWAALVLGIVVLGAGYGLFSSRRVIPTVQMVRVARSTFVDDIDSNGKIEAADAHIYRAQFETFVSGAFAKDGQLVRRGQTILTLDANQIRADLAQAKIQLLAAQDDLRNARAGGPPEEEAQLTGDLRAAQADVKRLQQKQEILEKLSETQASTRD